MSIAVSSLVRSPRRGSRYDDVLLDARRAQASWARVALADRLRVLARLRALIARDAMALADTIRRADLDARATSMVAEVMPLVDACRFLEREAEQTLKPARLGRRGRPVWLGRTRTVIQRDPLGVVLVFGPSNYPLFLPGVQALQALVAGNGVLLKPAPGCSAPLRLLARLLEEAGLDPALMVVLDEDVERSRALIESGVDKVVLTGSADTGRALLAVLAPTLTPAVMELSGCDAMFVLADADLDLVASALRFGLTFNGSETCIAPRRVFVPRELLPTLEETLRQALAAVPLKRHDAGRGRQLGKATQEALHRGARLVVGKLEDGEVSLPVVLSEVRPRMAVAQADPFAPFLSLLAVEDEEDALRQAAQCPYALGASVFGEPHASARFAARIPVGLVTINDVIAPSADPRLPFGGRKDSGFGATRGREGLLEMTAPKAIVIRRGRSRPHFEPFAGGEDAIFLALVKAGHGGRLRDRFRAVKELVVAAREVGRRRRALEVGDGGGE